MCQKCDKNSDKKMKRNVTILIIIIIKKIKESRKCDKHAKERQIVKTHNKYKKLG